jgi:hypothetical protein
MSLIYLLKNILNLQKKVDIHLLPSQGIFYPDDFEITIKRADIEDIVNYEYNYNKDNLGLIIQKLKAIVEKNCSVSPSYSYNDIKAIDIIFIFLEIVKLTNGKPVTLKYVDNTTGKEEPITFESTTFNYFNLDPDIMSHYDTKTKEFNFDGYRYSIPSIGVENSLTNFLVNKSETNSEAYNSYSYDFLYFLGNKSHLTFEEIENLIQIFNDDISTEDQKKLSKIVKQLSVIGRYSLKKESQIIDVSSKIDLAQIWK